jgi:hypothetical protein
MDNQKDNSLLLIGPPSVIPKLVRDKVENYRIVDIANEKIDKLHKLIDELLCKSNEMDEHQIYKCRHYDLFDGIKDYCENYVMEDGGSIYGTTNEVFYCNYCVCNEDDFSSLGYCYQHAKARGWKQRKDAIICNKCYHSKAYLHMHFCHENCRDEPDEFIDLEPPSD